ncbi:MAG TPA: Crp/Fnr family transcriptional regulator [Baekduia sp.]|jgi:CRP-like cAMP-binding protein
MVTTEAFVHLLDVEPDLAVRLRDDDRAEAFEQLRMPVLEVPAGEWAMDAGDGPAPLGFMVVSGLLLQEVRLASRSAMQLLGPGDVVLPNCAANEVLDAELRWSAAVTSRVAVLDERILQACFSQWPGLGLGLVQRTGSQLMRSATQAAIAQLPRVDQRLEAMFWDLAGRWGHVTPSGIHLPLPLSHEVLARLVGGRRPTITLALKALADRGVVARRPDRSWLLVADAPTLPSARAVREPPPLPALPVVSITATEIEQPAWQPDARRELLATASRMRARHGEQGHRHAANLRRYEEARVRSRELREAIARQRELRLLERDATS